MFHRNFALPLAIPLSLAVSFSFSFPFRFHSRLALVLPSSVLKRSWTEAI